MIVADHDPEALRRLTREARSRNAKDVQTVEGDIFSHRPMVFGRVDCVVERELLPACARYGVGVMTYAPLNNGWLTGKYRLDAAPPSDGRLVRLTGWDPDAPAARAKLDLVGSLGELAQAGGVSMVHLAHAWALRHPAVSSVIMGPRTMEQLDSALGAVDVELPPDLLDRIDALVPAGSDVDPAEATWTLGSLEPAARRRGSAERDVFEVPEGDWRRPGAR